MCAWRRFLRFPLMLLKLGPSRDQIPGGWITNLYKHGNLSSLSTLFSPGFYNRKMTDNAGT